MKNTACLLTAIFFGLTACGVSKPPTAKCMSAKDLRVSFLEMKRLQRFVAKIQEDEADDRRYNHRNRYCFVPIAVNKDNVGLVSIWRRGNPHEGLTYFINGRRRITPLNIEPVSPQRFGPTEHSAEEKQQVNKTLEKALARHADEIDDSLKYRIRHYFN